MTNPTFRPGHDEGRCDRFVRNRRRAHEFLHHRRGGLTALAAVSLVLTAGASMPPASALTGATSTSASLASRSNVSQLNAASSVFPLLETPLLGTSSLEPPVVPPVRQAQRAPSTLSRPVSAALTRYAVAAPVVPVRVVPPRVSAARGKQTPLRVVGPTYVGRASWYGPGFQGRRTANGERFDTQSLTAAHKTLPFGTRLRVCRQQQCVVVRVNDRGPYIRGRFLDLSSRAAAAIGLVDTGVCTVSATVIASDAVRTGGTWGKQD